MKQYYLMILMTLFTMVSNAQIDHNISYNSQEQSVSITMSNRFDNVVCLFAKSIAHENLLDFTYYSIEFENKEGDVLKKISDIPRQPSTATMTFLAPEESKTFKILLRRFHNLSNIYTIKVMLHMEGRLVKDKIIEREAFVKEDIHRDFTIIK